jgi:beta-galactosidase
MSINRITELYTKHVGDWGGRSTIYRFDAIKNGKVINTVTKCVMNKLHIEAKVSYERMHENTSYDVNIIRVRALDENGNVLPFCNEPIKVAAEGPVQIIGPDTVPLRGGMAAIYVKTIGKTGKAKITLSCQNLEIQTVEFEIV